MHISPWNTVEKATLDHFKVSFRHSSAQDTCVIKTANTFILQTGNVTSIDDRYIPDKTNSIYIYAMLARCWWRRIVNGVPASNYLLVNVWSQLNKHATGRRVEPLCKHIENQSHSQLQSILTHCGTPFPWNRQVLTPVNVFPRTLSSNWDRYIRCLQCLHAQMSLRSLLCKTLAIQNINVLVFYRSGQEKRFNKIIS
jgi:hypothetical protein